MTSPLAAPLPGAPTPVAAAPTVPPAEQPVAIPPVPPAGSADVDVSALLGTEATQQWYHRKSVWAAVATLVILVGALAWWWQRQQPPDASQLYTTQPVARGNLTLLVTANGTIQPTLAINIGSELSGTVRNVLVNVNDHVTKGQVMVELDTALLRDQILRARAALAAAVAKVAETDATILEAQASMDRLEAVARLSGGKVPAKTELDTGHAILARAIADDATAKAQVDDARAALSTNEITLSKASIRAPANGIILTRTVDPGNTVAASLQAVTLFTLAEDLRQLRVWVYVDEADVGSVKLGQEAVFTVSAYLSRNYPARISRVGLGSTITDNVVTYLTYMDVDNADMSLRPGMTATALITAMQRNNVLLVPNTALRFTPTLANDSKAGSKGASASLLPHMPSNSTRKSAASSASTANAKEVWVIPAGKGAAAVAIAVTPGISDGHMTEIVAGQLEVGMQVITNKKIAAP